MLNNNSRLKGNLTLKENEFANSSLCFAHSPGFLVEAPDYFKFEKLNESRSIDPLRLNVQGEIGFVVQL